MRTLLLLFVVFLPGCQAPAQNNESQYNQIRPERKLFKRSSAQLRPPTKYLMRETENGEYDPKPRVVLIDEKAGKYELRWIGYDQKEKIVAYTRMDALDGFVEANLDSDGSGFIYRYGIQNLNSSPNPITEFIVQSFSFDVNREPIRSGNDLHIGSMSESIYLFREGVWRSFAPLTDKMAIPPGTRREFQIKSVSRPGLVGCFAGAAEPTLKGVGEHMPAELENSLPGFEELASCITIGPDERLARMSINEKLGYLLGNLPKFVEAGWMAGDTPQIYEAILKRGDLNEALEQAKRDLRRDFITSEVYHIIEGLAFE